MKKINVSKALEDIVQSAANIFLIAILTLVFAEVISRYVFGRSYGFMEEFSKWSQIWMAYLMLGVLEKTRGHIKIDILYTRLPKRYQTILFLVFDVITLIFCILLFWSGIETARNWRLLDYISSIEIAVPMWIIMLSAPLGAFLLAFFAIKNLIVDIRSFSTLRRGVSSPAHKK